MNSKSTLSICHNCVGETFLSNLIAKEGRLTHCDYCQGYMVSISIDALSNHVQRAFEQHYERTSNIPNSYESMMLSDDEFSYEWKRAGDPVVDVIESVAIIPYQAASDVQEVLESRFVFGFDEYDAETDFDSNCHYEESVVDDNKWRDQWRSLEYAIRNENRFFNSHVLNTLTTLFQDIEKISVGTGASVLVSVGPNEFCSSIYRARVFDGDSELELALKNPEKELGPPPSAYCNSGRMNAAGISVFYGSNEARTAIAEVRPSVGSTVVTARFAFTRSLRLLDLDALAKSPETGSVFDPEFCEKLERFAFLRGLEKRLIVPVAPSRENLDYVVTQTIADFLAAHSSNIDGIRFNSTQVSEQSGNIVLFHKSSRVELPASVRERQINKFPDDYEDPDSEQKFYVSTSLEGVDSSKISTVGLLLNPPVVDCRESALSLDLKSIELHKINGVTYNSKAYYLEKSPYSRS